MGARWSKADRVRAGVLALVIFVTAGALYWSRGALGGTFDANLAARAQMLAANTWARSDRVFPELAGYAQAFAQVRDGEGRSIWRSPSLGIADLPNPSESGRLTDFSLPEGMSGRGYCVDVLAADGKQYRAVYAMSASSFSAGWWKAAGAFVFLGVVPAAVLMLLYPNKNIRA